MDTIQFYIEQINKVIDYIEANLENRINLDELAQVACLSKFHFHRIFYSFTNESLYSFINRLRVERAAALLLTQKNTITDIAFSCGFNDSATKDIIIYHDPIGITDKNKLRISVGITVSDDVLVSGEIGKFCISKGRYIICRFKLKNEEYGQAWAHVYRRIIPQRGLQPNDGYCFEMYPYNCYDKENDTATVDICVPIKRL